MKIGIDFDNTIAKYDNSFLNLAYQKKFIKKNEISLGKTKLKNLLLKKKGGKKKWMELQGLVYGKYMHTAEIFPNFINFLFLSKIKKHELFIISHKTKYGHFDKDKVLLRSQALKWMVKKKIFDKNFINFEKKNIFFANTRVEKIKIIKDLNCDWFIDDLYEVLTNKNFPSKTKKILFNHNQNIKIPNKILPLSNWDEIINHILGKFTEKEICFLFKFITNKKIIKNKQIHGQGNSIVYKALTDKRINYAIKLYPDLLSDPRPRLNNEFSTLKKMHQNNIKNVPKAIIKNEIFNIGIYEWINGNKILRPNEKDILQMVKLVKKLKNLSKKTNILKFNFASEACLSRTDLINQIQKRVLKLQKINTKNRRFKKFLMNDFIPLWKKIKNESLASWPKSSRDNTLNKKRLVLNPSDFGFHNTLKKKNKLFFLDFEYFGWDDPVKLTADFIWHPSHSLNKNLQQIWEVNMINIFSDDKDFKNRLNASMPLYGIRWILIILNEFLPNYADRRKRAANRKSNSKEIAQNIQLLKAYKYFDVVKNLYSLNSEN